MRNILKKSALASAMAFAMAGQASAATYLFDTASDDTVVFASEIFGDEEGTGANDTTVTMAVTVFDVDATTGTLLTGSGDNLDAGETAKIKFTLNKGAHFGQDLSNAANIIAANSGLGAFHCAAGAVGASALNVVNDTECGAGGSNVDWQVDQGGQIGVNTITFLITNNSGAEATIGGFTFGGVNIKNLIPALGDVDGSSTFRGSVEMGNEYNEGTVETTADAITTTASATPLAVFGSQPGINLSSSTAVNFEAAPFLRINVGNGEASFTDGADGRVDFDGTTDTTWVELGTIKMSRTTIDTATFTAANAGIVKNENGVDFNFKSGDTHNLVLTTGSGSFQVGSTLALEDSGSCGTIDGVAALTNEANTIASGEENSAAFPLTGDTTALTTSYKLCYAANGTSSIPEVGGIAANWDVTFFDPRYDNTEANYSAWGNLIRNGCIASFFNVPASDNATDTAFVRITNTGTTNTGDIRGTIWAQDGSVVGGATKADMTIAPDLAPHATQVFSSKADDIVITGGKDILSLETAFGITPADFGPGGSRGRLILKGAFDTCEGMGLIRTGDNGSLFNMTSTTMGNEAAAPNDGNNAQ